MKIRRNGKKGKEMEQFMNSMMSGEVDGGGKLGTTDEEKAALNSDDGIPIACHICRGPFKSPIVTTCGHYFW